MSFIYASIGVGLGIAKVADRGEFRGSLTGTIHTGTLTETRTIWGSFQALGAIAFAYSYSLILIDIQDTLKSPPSESKTMNKATLISLVVTTVFNLLCGCSGYASLGDLAPENLLSGFGYSNLFWLINIANGAIVMQLIGAYQFYCQPIFAFIEKHAAEYFPDNNFINKENAIPFPGGFEPYKPNLFRLVWRTIFVIITVIISMVAPSVNNLVGSIEAIGFWTLNVYFINDASALHTLQGFRSIEMCKSTA